jgi:hypothetical protein
MKDFLIYKYKNKIDFFVLADLPITYFLIDMYVNE